MEVKFQLNGKDLVGSVHELLPSDGLVKVKFTDPTDNKQKIWKGSIDKISLNS